MVKSHPNSKFDIDVEKQICQEYLQGVEFGSIVLSHKYGCSPLTILCILDRHEIPHRNRSSAQIGIQNNQKNNNWKGGRYIAHGYVMILDPSEKGKYIYEHRLIAEQKLGRALKEDERVHHIDGNKQNNHPDNLKVFDNFGSDHSVVHFEQGDMNHLPKRNILCQSCGKDRLHYARNLCSRCFHRIYHRHTTNSRLHNPQICYFCR